MFDPDLLTNVPSAIEVTSKNPDLLVRPLQANDFGRGFIDLLKQLTSVGSVSESDFKERFHLMKSCQSTYFNTVIVDKTTDKVIGAATLIVERKFIHSCANVRILISKSIQPFKNVFSSARNHRRSYCQRPVSRKISWKIVSLVSRGVL